MKNKDDLIQNIEQACAKVMDKAKTDRRHSYAYYETFKKICESLKDKLNETILMECLEPDWSYGWDINYDGDASVYLIHTDRGAQIIDQEFVLIKIPTHMLSVEEFAKMHEIEVGTVRQWLRRSKLRTAKKQGGEWQIPEFVDIPGRGYSPANYSWNETLEGLPEEYLYLNKYNKVRIIQSDLDKKKYNVTFYENWRVRSETLVTDRITLDTKAREKLELLLIAHPQIRYIPSFQDSYWIDLIDTNSELEE